MEQFGYMNTLFKTVSLWSLYPDQVFVMKKQSDELRCALSVKYTSDFKDLVCKLLY